MQAPLPIHMAQGDTKLDKPAVEEEELARVQHEIERL
jgi:hypothetical protein